jgi:hypothetical protein
MKKEITKYFPLALHAVEEYLLKDAARKIVWEEYDGHAASLGPSIRISGLIPALAFYTDVGREGNERKRNPILKAIYDILRPTDEATTQARTLLNTVLEEIYPSEDLIKADEDLPPGKLNEEKLADWSIEIVNASIALKLALRTFIHSDQKLAKDES